MRTSELSRLTLELTDLPTWANGVKAILARSDIDGRPWHYFADENQIRA
jgi:hypothetical protein